MPNPRVGPPPQFEALRQQLKATAADLVARLRELGCTVTSAAVSSPAKPSAEQLPGSQPKLRSYQVQTRLDAARCGLVLISGLPVVFYSACICAFQGRSCSIYPWLLMM